MLEIYEASVKNVQELKKSRKKIKRLVNASIKNEDDDSIKLLTKFLTLTYSSFAEACFLKVIHTPYGFTVNYDTKEDYIEQINSQRNLSEKWKKCVELGFYQIESFGNIQEVRNKRNKIEQLVTKYIIEPSSLRNKIAHGQWRVALNSDNSAHNEVLTNRLNNLDFVQVDVLFEFYEKISEVVKDLIESPYRAHFKYFYKHLAELEDLIEEKKNWNTETKKQVLRSKYQEQSQ